MPLPTDSAHLSDQARTEMIEEYGGVVESQFAKKSMMRRFNGIKPVRGTDTLINRRVGRTTLKALTPGVRPDADSTNFGRTSVTVDTVVLARDNRSMLNEFQTDFNARRELGMDHGKELGKFFDEAFLIQAMKGALLPAPANLNGAIGAGKVAKLAAPGNENDPDLLYAEIVKILVAMQEEDIDTEECAIFVRPSQHEVLLNNDKLVNGDYSSAGDFADGKFKGIMGSPVISTARIPQAAISGHLLSNADNSNAYDVSADEAQVKAIVMHPKSLLAGETIPMTSDVFFSREEKQWFIDSFLAFGVANNRPDVCGGVWASGASGITANV
jgi:hypothetical protein